MLMEGFFVVIWTSMAGDGGGVGSKSAVNARVNSSSADCVLVAR